MMSRSEAMNRDEHLETRRIMMRLYSTKPEDTITAQFEMLNVGHTEEQNFRKYVSKRILARLSYSQMTSRYEAILQAHAGTFDWIFYDAEEGDLPWSNFREWLEGDGDIYWISGKAGSGKSTLMKHIYDDRKTKQYLQSWSRRLSTRTAIVPCCIATFFFWNSGTDIQQSQQGLLRSLLFQVLNDHHDLVPIVFPARWAELYAEPMDSEEALINTWSMRELHEAFERLVEQNVYSMKICFFIDGLDEYSGDSENICIFFGELSTKNNRVKFCLSSRPWVQFQQNFEDCAGCRLQDLTAKDIDIFVGDKFRRSPAFMRLARRDAQLMPSLKCEIMDRAQGVFLWVEVVVRLLLRGVNNRDSIGQLWTRLRSFPRDLYPLYNAILEQIEPIYLQWASKAFQIIKRTTELDKDPFRRTELKNPGNVTEGEKIDFTINGVLPLTVVQVFAALSDEHDPESISAMSTEELNSACEDTQIHLTARCAGLLELGNTQDSARFYQHSPIVYMHRTARDFLEREDQWAKVMSYAPPETFSPDTAMLRSSIILLMAKGFTKRPLYTDYATSGLISDGIGQRHTLYNQPMLNSSRMVEDITIYAYHADDNDGTRGEQTKLLNIYNAWRSSTMEEPQPIIPSYRDRHWLRESALLSLSGYVHNFLSVEEEETRSEVAENLLYAVLSSAHSERLRLMFPKPKMVQVLLKLRSDRTMQTDVMPRLSAGPCWPSQSGTIVRVRANDDVHATPRFLKAYVSMLEAFLSAGVDPTDISSRVPKHYLLNSEALITDIRQNLLKLDCEADGTSLYRSLRSVFERSVITFKENRTFL
jgi:hypothetical protein